MEIPQAWLFPSSLEEAKVIQQMLSQKIIVEDNFNKLELIGGMDVSNNLYDPIYRKIYCK